MQTAILRVALLMSNAQTLLELEEILKSHYSSLLILTERVKLLEFDIPFIVVVDSMQELSEVKRLPLPEASSVLLVAFPSDSEMISVAFELGATDFLSHPFEAREVVAKVEKYLQAFRSE